MIADCVLGIETSCDETSAAIVRDGWRVLSNVVSSQAELHARHGGVVPELAAREQLAFILPVIEEALRVANVDWADISAVAATQGPGLAGPLLVGWNAAKAIAVSLRVPFAPVHHIQAHIYANWLRPADGDTQAPEPRFPLIGLVVSGGHTELIAMPSHGHFHVLGRTRDDAAGEAFDKAARLMGLSYPGGPSIQRAAASAGPDHPYRLPRAWLPGTDDFSFSGLKTAALHRLRELGETVDTPAFAREFEDAVVEVLATKTARAAERYGSAEVILAGGVAANRRLREALPVAVAPLPVSMPRIEYCTDNAAMIAGVAGVRLRLLGGDDRALAAEIRPHDPLERQPTWITA